MNWSVTISDEPDAPDPRYRVALNIGDDYVPLEPQSMCMEAECLSDGARMLIEKLIRDERQEERAACLAIVDAEGLAAVQAHELLASSRIARIVALIKKRGAK